MSEPDPLAEVARRLQAERFSPEWTCDPERAARARANGPTAQWAKALAEQERKTVLLEDWRARQQEIRQSAARRRREA